ncbi:uncharacterized protein BCR38DRAFT_527535 [Pseudomassariella vexata]|uniref:non-specific serine/threonine protein kinase n=1 Tax=Pseudomassariella vexata TaxID=1141098 RepID=A0A1Y2DI78_9PEZI|nr:uncharacterized protein BCR38DRAFT_527535 [Pseudomassariella vexata]ORY58515.1 hypothetical protein BCR38DRAFT_527535 [Pseudomassariella vexata]
MTNQDHSKVITENPIGTGLDSFRASFNSTCGSRGISCSPDSLDRLDHDDLQDLTLDLLVALQGLRTPRLLPSTGRGKNLLSDLTGLNSAVNSNHFDFDPLTKCPDGEIWDQVYIAVTESTPPPRPAASSLQQTPWLYNISSPANSAEYRQDVDRVHKQELGPLYAGLRQFREKFCGRVPGLEVASKAVFEKCLEGDNPPFKEGWVGWPKDAKQDDVLSWFAGRSEKLAGLGKSYNSALTNQRRPLAQPNKPIQGSTGERKLNIGFVNDSQARKDSHCHWRQILVPGEVKSNPSANIASKAWLDLGRYAREVLTAQDTRRFVLGFTLCGSLMRIWEFDRLVGIASEQFDINQDGPQFVFTILGFLWMTEEELGFDPTIITKAGQRYVHIQRNGQTERIVIEKIMKRAPCVAGRATTCWKAYRDGHPEVPLVIKDSWQYTERDEEGELLKEATDKDVVNLARYYHHETVYVRGAVDNIRDNIRGGLNITEATNYRPERSVLPTNESAVSTPRISRSGYGGTKRSSSQTGASLPPAKRCCSASPTKAGYNPLQNRVHRRLILRDYGTPIYEARSRTALFAAFEGSIKGHQSLHQAGLLHRDISINNIMINEDETNPSWPSFLIDMDLAIREIREGASGARGKTGIERRHSRVARDGRRTMCDCI